jgi:hypothetical protein
MKLPILLIALGTVMIYSCQAQQFDTKNIRNHIKTLADDGLEGRATGSKGERIASDYIIAAFKKNSLIPKGDNAGFTQKFPFKHGVHGEGITDTAINVVGYLDNQAATTIIIGAHYDHLGNDGQNSSLDPNPKQKIHNGADDNASGVAGVLELARYFSTNKKREKNNFLFITFSGEELGLLGSKYFADNSPVDLNSVNFMINMDMIGRLDPQTKTVVVHGTGTSPVWQPLLTKLESAELKIKMDSSGVGPSDHTSFYLKNLPVLHFFTGAHSDYHKPTDDWDKINVEGEANVLRLIADIIENLDSQPKLTFLKTKSNVQTSRSSFKVTLGIMPSYAASEEGLKVDGVTDGRPGQKAGIQSGDVIIKMGEYPIKNIQHYMDALGKFEKGQVVPVKVKRNEQEIELSVTF